MTTQDSTREQRLRELFGAIGIKGELRRIASKALRETPEYARAREERRAREWLEQESNAMAEGLYMAMQALIKDLDA